MSSEAAHTYDIANTFTLSPNTLVEHCVLTAPRIDAACQQTDDSTHPKRNRRKSRTAKSDDCR